MNIIGGAYVNTSGGQKRAFHPNPSQLLHPTFNYETWNDNLHDSQFANWGETTHKPVQRPTIICGVGSAHNKGGLVSHGILRPNREAKDSTFEPREAINNNKNAQDSCGELGLAFCSTEVPSLTPKKRRHVGIHVTLKNLGLETPVWSRKSQLPCPQRLRSHGSTSSDSRPPSEPALKSQVSEWEEALVIKGPPHKACFSIHSSHHITPS